jgi:hypothetical protein
VADSLGLSPEVLARIRALQGDDGRTADEVLRLLLGLPPAAAADAAKAAPGFEDATYAVRFPEGFEIFRTYKGRPYGARVAGGRWRLDADGKAYDSLNQLSQAVIDGNENAWMFWFYRDADGRPRRIARLRDPGRVQRRPRRRKPARLEAAARPTTPAAAPSPPQGPAAETGMAWQPRIRPLPGKR